MMVMTMMLMMMQWMTMVTFEQSQMKSGFGKGDVILKVNYFGIGTDGHFEVRSLVVTRPGDRVEALAWPVLLYTRRCRNRCLGHVVKRKRPVPRDLVKALSNLELQRPKTHRFAPNLGITPK